MSVIGLLNEISYVVKLFYWGFWLYLIVNLSQIYAWGNSIYKHMMTMYKENQAITNIQMLCKSDNNIKQDLSLVTDVCNKNISNMVKDHSTIIAHAVNESWPLLPFLFRCIITYWYIFILASILLYSVIDKTLQWNRQRYHQISRFSV